MEGEGTIIPATISALQPPARDRDPARAGGVALTREYVTGSWTAPGIDADCDRPDFQISQSPGAMVIETSVNGAPETGRVVLGNYPRIDWDDPLPDMPLESRGPDGLAVLRPATDAEYDQVEVAATRLWATAWNSSNAGDRPGPDLSAAGPSEWANELRAAGFLPNAGA